MPADGFDAGFRRRCIREIPVTQKVHYSTTVVHKGRIYRARKSSRKVASELGAFGTGEQFISPFVNDTIQ